MNTNEAKSILLLYRPGAGDEADPQVAEALALAKENAELGRWLGEQCARQEVLRGKFRQVTAPAGLKEQIISEQAARERAQRRRPRLVLAVLVMILGLVLSPYWLLPYLPERHPPGDTVAIYQAQMADTALRGYGMDIKTNDPAVIRAYLALKKAPADFVLSAALEKAPVAGCAVEGWQDGNVAMVCFQTGRPLPPGQTSDLWLFVANRASLRDPPAPGQPEITVVNHLTEAIWTDGDKVYLLGLKGDESTLRKFL